MKVEMRALESIKPYEKNAKKHDQTQIDNVAESIRQYGFVQPIVVDKDGIIVIGHCRALGAKKLGIKEVPCVCVDDLTPEQVNALRLVDNKSNESDWDFDLLADELPDLDLDGFDFDWDFPMYNDDGEGNINKEKHAKLSDTFLVPPFSILDTRSGEWTERKRLWRKIINDDGHSRGSAQTFSKSITEFNGNGKFADVSLLDPVLAEVILTWFLPRGQKCKTFDTFAGDTVFGFVSAFKGNEFTGTELRKEQADFNQEQCDRAGIPAKYHCDDGRNIQKHIENGSQDLYFSCPPYYDLEVYSDLENDASNQKSYADFYKILDEAFSKAVECLKENRFAVVVASDVRNKKTGGYYDFISDIKKTFVRNGCLLYNEIVLVNAVGTAAIRVGRYMKSRKVARIHQEVLVFYKGDPSKIHSIFGDAEVAKIDESEDV